MWIFVKYEKNIKWKSPTNLPPRYNCYICIFLSSVFCLFTFTYIHTHVRTHFETQFKSYCIYSLYLAFWLIILLWASLNYIPKNDKDGKFYGFFTTIKKLNVNSLLSSKLPSHHIYSQDFTNHQSLENTILNN